MLYNNAAFPSAQRADEAALERWLDESPQGTLVVALTPDGARDAQNWLVERGLSDRVDGFVGAWPDDPRAFNALCLCPVGAPPRNYTRLLLWNFPPEALGFSPACPVFSLVRATAPGWLAELPDIDRLRALYIHLRTGPERSEKAPDTLVLSIAESSGLSPVAVIAGLRLLNQMQLLRTRGEPPTAVMAASGPKCDPERDPLFIRLAAMRTCEGR